MTEMLGWLVGGGTGLATLITTVVMLRKAGPESRQVKVATEAALQEMADKWLVKQDKEIHELTERCDVLELRMRRMLGLLELHGRWDRQARDIAHRHGIELPPTPPLYLDDIPA